MALFFEVYKELLRAFISTPKKKKASGRNCPVVSPDTLMSKNSNGVVIYFPKFRRARVHIVVVTRISR